MSQYSPAGEEEYVTLYRVSQKFVPLISCTITFDQNFIFTWNFYKMFISLSSTCIQNFSNWHALFVFLSHSVAVAARTGIQRVDPQMIHFELFYHLVRRIQFNPQLKKIYFGHSSKKDNHPGPLPQQGFCTSLQIWNELGVNWQTKQRFFCHLRGL